jgi:O-antigen/teichoic acid export membrane protein
MGALTSPRTTMRGAPATLPPTVTTSSGLDGSAEKALRMPLQDRLRRFRATELGGLAGDSFYVAIWQGSISVADLVQLALITHVLGLAEFGRLALAMSFVVLVGQFFDMRIGAAATTFAARRLAAHDLSGAAGVFQLSYMIDASTGVLGFAVVAALSPVVGPHLIGGNGTTLMLLYGATLLVSTVDESSISILRLFDRFRLIASYTAGLEALRIGLVAGALAISPSLSAVLIALVAYDLVGAAANLMASTQVFRRVAGKPLRKPALTAFHEKRGMMRMAMQTNVVSYARIAQVQLPTLLLGALGTTIQVGIYKLGTAGASIIGRLADPAYAAVLPRLSRLAAADRSTEVRRLVERATLLAFAVLSIALLLLVILRDPILRVLGGADGRAAGTVLILAAIAQALNGTLFWNVGLLYATGRSGVVAAIALVGVVLQVGLIVPLVWVFQAEGAAVALLASFALTNFLATFFAWKTVKEGVNQADTDESSTARSASVPLATSLRDSM